MSIWEYRRDGEEKARQFDSSIYSAHDVVAEEIAAHDFDPCQPQVSIQIDVRKQGDVEWMSFKVDVEMRPVFSARRMKT